MEDHMDSRDHAHADGGGRVEAFTPGPWFCGPTPSYLDARQSSARHGATITIRSPHHTEEIATVWTCLLPQEANARLIAAAPDLLEAAQLAFYCEVGASMGHATQVNGWNWPSEAPSAVSLNAEKLRAAIAKALAPPTAGTTEAAGEQG